VCDEPASLETLVAALLDAGYRATNSATGDAAVLLGAFRFALVVADAGPTSGDVPGAAERRETVERLRDLVGDTPFLVVPAHDAAIVGPLILSFVHRDRGGE
jgi:hypothetical protein